jgi:hypothetical protein
MKAALADSSSSRDTASPRAAEYRNKELLKLNEPRLRDSTAGASAFGSGNACRRQVLFDRKSTAFLP